MQTAGEWSDFVRHQRTLTLAVFKEDSSPSSKQGVRRFTRNRDPDIQILSNVPATRLGWAGGSNELPVRETDCSSML